MIDKQLITDLFSISSSGLPGSLLCIVEGDDRLVLSNKFDRDDLVNTYSVSKLIVSLATYCCWENGIIGFDKPIDYYWPEFSKEGKNEITVGHVMEHSSGVPHFGKPMTTQDTFDWGRACEVLAQTAPLHRPGEAAVYHARTYGFLLGEVIRRATGCSLADFVAENLFVDGSEFYFGVPAGRMGRVLPLSVPGDLESRPGRYRASNAASIPSGAAPYAGTVFQNPANDILAPNDPAWLQSVIPSSGGVSNASMIVDILRYFFAGHPRSRDRILNLTKDGKRATIDLALGFPVNWIGGFEANNGEFGDGATRFGYRAIGGSIVFFDLHRDLYVCYTTSVMIPQPGLHPAHDPRIERILPVI